MKKALFVVATVSAAPALTFDRPASTKVNVELGTRTGPESCRIRTEEGWFGAGFSEYTHFFRKMLHLCHFNKQIDQTEKISSRITLLKMETPNIMLNSTTTLVRCIKMTYRVIIKIFSKRGFSRPVFEFFKRKVMRTTWTYNWQKNIFLSIFYIQFQKFLE